MSRQLALDLPQWGGRRKGAGRPRTRSHPGLDRPGVPHLARPVLSRHHPVHVTQRVQSGVGYLRGYRRAQIIEEALRAVRLRFGMQVAHYSIQGNHLHLIVEADDAGSLSRGMQALAIRIARRLNALAGRSGGVFVDRYHAHALVSRREVANAVRYVLGNYRHHSRERSPSGWRDPLSSSAFVATAPGDSAPVTPPRTWLLRIGWKLESPVRRPRLRTVGGVQLVDRGYAARLTRPLRRVPSRATDWRRHISDQPPDRGVRRGWTIPADRASLWRGACGSFCKRLLPTGRRSLSSAAAPCVASLRRRRAFPRSAVQSAVGQGARVLLARALAERGLRVEVLTSAAPDHLVAFRWMTRWLQELLKLARDVRPWRAP